MSKGTIAAHWHGLQQEVQRLCIENGRHPGEVEVIAVSKFQPFSAIQEVVAAGCLKLGENRVQEALQKMTQGKELPFVEWHLIGTLQKNKVRKIIGKFALIHSVDSLELAQKISEESLKMSLKTPILLQVDFTSEQTKHGMDQADVLANFLQFASLQGVDLKGLMTIGPLSEDKDLIRQCFRGLKNLRNALREYLGDKEALPHLSMGMTHDYPLAIAEGATLLRIGSALFGSRS